MDPGFVMIDSADKVEIKRENQKSLSTFYKNESMYFGEADELREFVDRYLNGDKAFNPMVLSMGYFDKMQTKVKWVNTQKFEQDFAQNDKVDQCILEVVKDHCPGCMATKPITNVLSRKMEAHGLLQQLPIFRMDIHNESPYIYDLPHTPIHLYIRKEGGKIVEINMMKSLIHGK